jgi:hypothetical protein
MGSRIRGACAMCGTYTPHVLLNGTDLLLFTVLDIGLSITVSRSRLDNISPRAGPPCRLVHDSPPFCFALNAMEI